MSGNSLGLKPLPSAIPDMLYPIILQSLGLSDLTPGQRAERLKTLPFEDLLLKIPPNVPMLAVQDNDLIPEVLEFSKLPSAVSGSWCLELLIGDCSLDGMILGEMALGSRSKGIGKAFAASVRSSFTQKPEVADAILRSYDIDDSSPVDDKDWVSICKFASEIAFEATSTAWAETWLGHGPVYRYFFNEQNPWPGKYQGHATHILDAVFFLQNFNEFLNEEQKTTAKRMASDFISFANGKGVTPSFTKDNLPCVLYGKAGERDTDRQTGRRTVLTEIVQKEMVSWDELQAAWSNFLQGA